MTKREALSPAEWRILQTHPTLGANALRPLTDDPTLADAVRHHHERWDGQGYPHRLAGHTIPLAARVINIADAIVAICAKRSYQPQRTAQHAYQILEAEAGYQFDPEIAGLILDDWVTLKPALAQY